VELVNMSNAKYPKKYITLDGEEIGYHKINYDVNGNARYVVHFLSLGIKLADYGRIPKLTKYRAKWFGGGIVFQSYNLESDLRWHLNQVKEYYAKKQA
jgi:hypothetical protein